MHCASRCHPLRRRGHGIRRLWRSYGSTTQQPREPGQGRPGSPWPGCRHARRRWVEASGCIVPEPGVVLARSILRQQARHVHLCRRPKMFRALAQPSPARMHPAATEGHGDARDSLVQTRSNKRRRFTSCVGEGPLRAQSTEPTLTFRESLTAFLPGFSPQAPNR